MEHSFLLHLHFKQTFQEMSQANETSFKKYFSIIFLISKAIYSWFNFFFNATRSVRSLLMLDSTSFPQAPFSFFPKKYKEVNMKWALQMRPFIHDFQLSSTFYMTEYCFKPWLDVLHHMHLFNFGRKTWHQYHLCPHCRRFIQEDEERLQPTRWNKVST